MLSRNKSLLIGSLWIWEVIFLCVLPTCITAQIETCKDPDSCKWAFLNENAEEEDDDEEEENGEDLGDYVYAFHYDVMEMVETKVDPIDLEGDDMREISFNSMDYISDLMQQRMEELFENTKTAECRALITEHMAKFVNSLALEISHPFQEFGFELTNECPEPVHHFDNLPKGMTREQLMNGSYRAKEKTFIDKPSKLKLLYVILAHDKPEQVSRLIDTLQSEPNYMKSKVVPPTFVVHIDKKVRSDETFRVLSEMYAEIDNVHILPDGLRVSVVWGAFSMVEATLNCLKYIFCVDERFCSEKKESLSFDKLVHMAGNTYPIKPNREIREKLSKYPLEANFLYTNMEPLKPSPDSWHYFVECDDAVHRIYRLKSLRGNVGLYTGSQWFVMSHEFAEYITRGLGEPSSFVYTFTQYARHIVVADEHFFGTILRNTKFCETQHNDNFLYHVFGRWDKSEDQGQRQRCLFPNPNHCGRSPIVLNSYEMSALELSPDLFARKIDDVSLLDIIDIHLLRRKRRYAQKGLNLNEGQVLGPHGALLVDRMSLDTDMPMCLGTMRRSKLVSLLPCFRSTVIPTLEDDWFTGAVISEEVPFPVTMTWSVGRCSTDGDLNFVAGWLSGSTGNFTPSGPRCHIKQVRERGRLQLCLDGKTDDLQAAPCNFHHEKLFSFGPSPFVEDDSRNVPVGSIYLSLDENDAIIDYCIAELSDEDGEKYIGFVQCEEDEHAIEFAVVPFIVEES